MHAMHSFSVVILAQHLLPALLRGRMCHLAARDRGLDIIEVQSEESPCLATTHLPNPTVPF